VTAIPSAATTDLDSADDPVIDEASGADHEDAAPTGAAERAGTANRPTRILGLRWRPVALVALLLASGGTAAALYFDGYRHDRTTEAARVEAAKAASQGAIALLSYAPDSLDHDLAAARSHLTGGFLTYYSQFAERFLTPAAQAKKIHATASILRSATIDAQPGSAHVLIFLNQTTTSRDNPQPVQTASSVNVGLTKIDGAWRISSFDPI